MLTAVERMELERHYDQLSYEYAELSMFARTAAEHARRKSHREVLLLVERLLQEQNAPIVVQHLDPRLPGPTN